MFTLCLCTLFWLEKEIDFGICSSCTQTFINKCEFCLNFFHLITALLTQLIGKKDEHRH